MAIPYATYAGRKGAGVGADALGEAGVMARGMG